MYKVLDLFSGIGGFSLGLERTGGFKTVAFCEIDSYCRKVLAKHWPEVLCMNDIYVTPFDYFREQGIDVITGGFPCQDISLAGPGAGLAGSRSGLWRELIRAIRLVRPLYALVENVAALLNRGMDTVLGDLASCGYDAEWDCIPAAAVGARHIRNRVWIVAHPRRERLEGPLYFTDHIAPRLTTHHRSAPTGTSGAADWEGWAAEPAFLGKTDDVPDWMDRINALGNAVVPQIPELIGRAILQAEKEVKL